MGRVGAKSAGNRLEEGEMRRKKICGAVVEGAVLACLASSHIWAGAYELDRVRAMALGGPSVQSAAFVGERASGNASAVEATAPGARAVSAALQPRHALERPAKPGSIREKTFAASSPYRSGAGAYVDGIGLGVLVLAAAGSLRG